MPSYVVEFKYTKNKRLNLANLANKAVDQIIEEKYDNELRGTIIHVGLAHRLTPSGALGEEVEMVWKVKGQ